MRSQLLFYKAITAFTVLACSFCTTTASADSVKLLDAPEKSLSGFAQAIDGAQSSIDIATFILEPCHASVQVLIEKLKAQAKRGVKVRLLIDSAEQSEEQSTNLASDLGAYGIEVRLYNASLVDINFRMHAKMMVVDRKIYIVGGRNLADPYFGLSTSYNYVDRDILVEGESVAAAEKGFERLWNSEKSSLPEAGSVTPWESFCSSSYVAAKGQLDGYLRDHAEGVLKSVPPRKCDKVEFSVDDPDFDDAGLGVAWDHGKGAATFLTSARLKLKHATRSVLSFVAHSKQSLFVENPSYIPVYALSHAFARARKNNVEIKVLANREMDDGPQFFKDAVEYEYDKLSRRDSVGSQWVGLVASTGSLQSNFELTPLGTTHFIHSKVAVRDHRDVLVGSFNIDGRSANINIETAVVIRDCTDLADDVLRGIKKVQSFYDFDQTSGQVPAKPPADPMAIILGDLFLPQL